MPRAEQAVVTVAERNAIRDEGKRDRRRAWLRHTFRLAFGDADEPPYAVPLIDQRPGVLEWVVADSGYTSYAVRQHV